MIKCGGTTDPTRVTPIEGTDAATKDEARLSLSAHTLSRSRQKANSDRTALERVCDVEGVERRAWITYGRAVLLRIYEAAARRASTADRISLAGCYDRQCASLGNRPLCSRSASLSRRATL